MTGTWAGRLSAAVLLALNIGLTGSALSQTVGPGKGFDSGAIGKVLSAKGAATIEHSGAVVIQANVSSGDANQAKVGDLVYQGDVIVTGPDGALGIVFGDGTSFNISSNARMALNEFVYDPKGSSNSSLISLQKGTFTFLAGKVAKSGNMKVETPVGTMGIRGTAPHVEILDDGTVKFSTLIEQGRSKLDNNNKKSPSSKSAQRREPTPADLAAEQADKALSKKLRLCRDC